MEIKDNVKQIRDLQKSHKKVRVADFCRKTCKLEIGKKQTLDADILNM